jgi:hypothetical protein
MYRNHLSVEYFLGQFLYYGHKKIAALAFQNKEILKPRLHKKQSYLTSEKLVFRNWESVEKHQQTFTFYEGFELSCKNWKLHLRRSALVIHARFIPTCKRSLYIDFHLCMLHPKIVSVIGIYRSSIYRVHCMDGAPFSLFSYACPSYINPPYWISP